MFSRSSSQETKAARTLFDEGMTLFQEQRYPQALTVLQQAADKYRAVDARGHPFNDTLPNGISGLANTLALMGRCLRNRGDEDGALTFFEMSLVNERFERKKSFKKFLRGIQEDLRACYEHKLERYSEKAIDDLLRQPVQIDTRYRFPFSLDGKLVALARLYEIAPIPYERFRAFYDTSRKTDNEVRRNIRDTDETAIRTLGYSLWAVLFVIWSVYVVILIRVAALQ